MNVVTQWIRRQPLIAFYVLCYAITWGLWMPFVVTRIEILQLLAMIGVFGGPGIAGMIVSRVTANSADPRRGPHFRVSLTAAWLGCAAVFVVYQMQTSPGTSIVALAIFALLAGIPATIIAAAL